MQNKSPNTRVQFKLTALETENMRYFGNVSHTFYSGYNVIQGSKVWKLPEVYYIHALSHNAQQPDACRLSVKAHRTALS